MNVLIVEPYLTKSHEHWMNGLKNHLPFHVRCLSLPPRFWKWRMHGAAITLAHQLREMSWRPDCMILSDMMDVCIFLSLTRDITNDSINILYFHESQLTYPISDHDMDIQRQFDHHYPFINYTSALAANHVVFNSNFHQRAFLENLEPFLRVFPDYNTDLPVKSIVDKSSVIYPGIDLKQLDRAHHLEKGTIPVILWNHRWEYDKNPEDFFELLSQLKQKEVKFKLCILGQSFSSSPKVFREAKEKYASEIIQFGYEEDDHLYYRWLWFADIVVSTAQQEFFGISVLEAMYCRCFPLLPARLAYPEHIPSDLHSQCLYHSSDDLYEKIVWAIENPNVVRHHLDLLQEKAATYNIKHCTQRMRELLKRLKKEKK